MPAHRPDDLDAWLRLTATPGVGREAARRLLAAYGSAEGALAAGPMGWQRVGGAAAAQGLQDLEAGRADALLAATLAWLDAEPGRRHLVTLGDDAYPAALLQTADPPLMLYAQGRLDLLAAPAIAMVGSRAATAQGRDNARAFAEHFSRAGWVVVSGLALGIDGAAHEGALAGQTTSGGGTIAVIGTGPDRIYPRQHAALARRIAEHGLLLSELAVGTPSLPLHFPLRNRIIAGLAQGTLVVEAAPQSGSLITARQAADCGREVFAIPGSIHSAQSRGCHALIKQGAKLVETADDVLAELPGPVPGRTPPPAPPAAEPLPEGDALGLLAALGEDPATLDALSARTGWPADRLGAELLLLELDGRVARLPGGLFQRRHRA